MLALRTNGTSPASIGDDRLGAHLATRHLLDLGHRRIGLVCGPAYASSARDREAGYRDALTEAGVPVDETLLAGDSFSMEAGEIAGRTLLDRTDRPTAIFAVNDNTAIGVMAAAHALGLRIPDDLSLVGYNDIPIVSRLPVPLTTVRVPVPADRRERTGAPPRSRQRQPTPHPHRRADAHPAQVSRRLRTLSPSVRRQRVGRSIRPFWRTRRRARRSRGRRRATGARAGSSRTRRSLRTPNSVAT